MFDQDELMTAYIGITGTIERCEELLQEDGNSAGKDAFFQDWLAKAKPLVEKIDGMIEWVDLEGLAQ